MALQAQSAIAGIGNHRSVRHCHRAQDAQEVHVIGRSRIAVRFVTGLTANRAKDGVGSGITIYSANEALRSVATYTIHPIWPGGDPRG